MILLLLACDRGGELKVGDDDDDDVEDTDTDDTDVPVGGVGELGLIVETVHPTVWSTCEDMTPTVTMSLDPEHAEEAIKVVALLGGDAVFDGFFWADAAEDGRAPLAAELEIDTPLCTGNDVCFHTLDVELSREDQTSETDAGGLVVVPPWSPWVVSTQLDGTNWTDAVQTVMSDDAFDALQIGIDHPLITAGHPLPDLELTVLMCPNGASPTMNPELCTAAEADPITVDNADVGFDADLDVFEAASCASPSDTWAFHLRLVGAPCAIYAFDIPAAPFRFTC